MGENFGDWFNWFWFDLLWPVFGSPAVTIVLVFGIRWLDKRDQRRAERDMRKQIDEHEKQKLALLRNWLDDAG